MCQQLKKIIVSLCMAVAWAWPLCAATPETRTDVPAGPDRHVLVVGTGMAGLSAALEAAQNGARVTVLEMWSVFGGTSFISGGKVAIVGTARQERQGINDSPDLAFQDFINCGHDLDRTWVRYWAVFDEANKRRVYVAGSDLGSFPVVQRVIYDNADLVKSAPTLTALAKAAGLPMQHCRLWAGCAGHLRCVAAARQGSA